jgi:D-lactate dehydrogenase
MSAAAPLSGKLIEALCDVLGEAALLTSEADRWAYGYDNSRRQTLPGAVALPDTQDAVAAVLRLCHREGLPVTVRGRGTGTAGAAVPPTGGLALSTERLDRIVKIDGANRVAVVEPGVINQALQDAAGAEGFFWPPDPTSAAYSTIGGNLGCNAAGPRAVKYGTPRENTLGLRAVTGDGTVLRTGCYTTKGVVGFDLTRLLIGSEGALAVITEATLKLTPLPEAVVTLRATYRDMVAAAAAVSAIMAQPVVPRVLEFMDSAALDIVRDYADADLPADAGAMLILEADGPAALLDHAIRALEAAAGNDGLVEIRTAAGDEERVGLWACRKALSPSLRRIAPGKINEDVVVPVSRMAGLIDRLGALARRFDVRIVNFGHAGNGNIHVNLLGDLGDPAERERMHDCLDEVFRAVLDLGGTLSGEHGIGFEKKEFVGLEIEPATLEMMRRIKRQFDPAGILNPGKLFPDDAGPAT